MTAYIRKLLLLHDYIARGRGDTPTADKFREDLMDLFDKLSVKEQVLVTGLSGDLYQLADKSMYIKTSEDEKREIKAKIEVALEEKDWDTLLSQLRYGTGLSEKQIALYRAKAWESRSPEVAKRFYDFYLNNGGNNG